MPLLIPSVHVSCCPIFLPSPQHRPHPLRGRSVPPDVTDPQRLDELDVQNCNEVFGPVLNAHRVANGLAPLSNVRNYVYGEHPWLAADPVLALAGPGLGVVQTGAWIMPDQRLIGDHDDCFAVGEVNQRALFGRVTADLLAGLVSAGGGGRRAAVR